MDKRISTWLSGFLVGSALGAVFALLNAPSSGMKTRAQIRDKTTEFRAEALNTIEENRQRAEDYLSDVSNSVRKRGEALGKVGSQVMNDQRKVIEKGAQRAKKAVTTSK